MRIKNVGDLQELEARIGMAMGRYELPQVLMGLDQLRDRFQPFSVAGMTLFAIKYARAPILRSNQIEQLTRDQLGPLAHLVTLYLLADPSSFEPPVVNLYHGSALIPVILRHAGNQFVYQVSMFGQYARSLKLFRDIPLQMRARRKNARFNFHESFRKLNQATITEFIDVGFTAYAAARARGRFTIDYFREARALGVCLPDDTQVVAVLDKLAGDQFQMREKHEETKQRDRRYGAYDYNPLFVYPIVRPWPKRADTRPEDDRLIAPLPDLILTRMSEGIYQQLAFEYKKAFTDYFGPVFETYVGEVLRKTFPAAGLISEKEIRRTYSTGRGKAPDWVVIDYDRLYLFESKATGPSRKSLAMGDQKAIDDGINNVIDGLVQLHEFRDACRKGVPGLERFHSCSDIRSAVVTFEPFYIVNSDPFAELIDNKLRGRGVTADQWYVLAVDQLEKLQPPIVAGINYTEVLDRLQSHEPTNKVFESLYETTGVNYSDSFLYDMDMEIYKRLGLPDEDDSQS